MLSIYQFKHRRAQCVVLFIVHSVCGGFYHSSTTRMRTLLEIQDKLINQITHLIHHKYEKVSSLEYYLKLLKKERTKSLEDEETYLDNPINDFKLIKVLSADLDVVETQIRECPAFEIDKDKYPDMKDLTEAIAALERLRRIYKLNITEMASGTLKLEKSAPMSITDCIDLALLLYKHEMYNATIDWLGQALLKYSLGELAAPTALQDILSGLAFSYQALDDETNSQLWKRRIHKHYKINKSYREIAEELIKSSPRLSTLITSSEYDRLCRGETNISGDVQSKLKCFYINRYNPFLKLVPFKLEQLHIDPDVNMVHDVMNDNEIQQFMDSATSEMAPVEIFENNPDSFAQTHVAQVAWFNTSYSEIMDRISKRMTDFSGFELASAGDLQLVNYGIGGYDPHYVRTTFVKNSSNNTEPGDRYATILIYLSDVSFGGSTVFINLGLTVPPKKGAAIFWRNILPTGEGDPRTMHAACPVLLGNKWILNRWLNSAGQEDKATCTNGQKISEV